jgi:Zn-dependent protease with chaperone function
MRRLNMPAVQAVLAHELGHLKCDHGLWLTVANVIASGTVSSVCDQVITFYSPEAVIMTSEDFAPQRGAMHQCSVGNVIFHPQSQPAVAAALSCV